MSNPTTVRVRIAVYVHPDTGDVYVPSQGPSLTTLGAAASVLRRMVPDKYTLVWVEADVPLPTETVVEGRVVGDE